MGNKLQIKNIIPTIFLKREERTLKQLIMLEIVSSGSREVMLLIKAGEKCREMSLGALPQGESIREVFIDEMKKKADVEFILKSEGIVYDSRKVSWSPPRHWVVHVVQLSHHDPGYTDLPSNVLKTHDRWLDEALLFAGETDNFPDDAKFRMVIEQTWSIHHYLKNSPEFRINRMVDLMRSGRIEPTALFGNMTTEICGHEELIRALYHAFSLKRKYGIQIVSAEHNDITGISWGLSRVITDAGIKIFCPGIPLYYNWSERDGSGLSLNSFWDEKAIFPNGGPGAFWWEAPSGKKLLFWCNNQGCGGDCHAGLPGLSEKLKQLEEQDYPYRVIRWPVSGGSRDNSPYITGYAHTIKDWNEKWAYPHLICSTNAKFYEDFIKEVPEDLPVFKGELPGQDYPIGAVSTAAPTAENRNNHSTMITAEKLASMAETMTDYTYQKEDISQAYEDMLWYDEHAWGHHFPCGPAMKASQYEKAIHSYRASALAHDITSKAMAKIADNIKLEEEGFYLVVFNSTSFTRTEPVRALLREMDNCGSTMYVVPPEEDPKGEGYLKGVLLGDRWHANPPLDIVEGRFDLIDISTGEHLPFQLIEIQSAMDAVPHAGERLGIGSGTKRYGFFEVPLGLKRDLCFIAEDVPAFGYKTYSIILKNAERLDEHNKSERIMECSGCNPEEGFITIENEYYRISVDKCTGRIKSILDKEAARDVVDGACPHGFNSFIVREPDFGDRQRVEYHMENIEVSKRLDGEVCKAIEIISRAYGHPVIRQEIVLYKGIKKIHFNTKVIKDPTPLLDVHLAFPFKVNNPVFRYEGVLSAMNPIEDYLPGSYSDTVAVQNWVKVTDGSYSVLWSSLDAPVAGFSGLHPGYVSPAHRCLIDGKAAHPPMKKEQFTKGWIYSSIYINI